MCTFMHFVYNVAEVFPCVDMQHVPYEYVNILSYGVYIFHVNV